MKKSLVTRIKIPKGYHIVLEDGGGSVSIYKHEIIEPSSVREIVNELDSAQLAIIKDHWKLA